MLARLAAAAAVLAHVPLVVGSFFEPTISHAPKHAGDRLYTLDVALDGGSVMAFGDFNADT